MIYHLLLPEAWFGAQKTGEHAPVSLEKEGFVHLSTEAQLLASANRYFPEAEVLWALGLDAETAGPLLRWEPSREGQDFPHLYRPIVPSEVAVLLVLERGMAGRWEGFKKENLTKLR